MRVMAVLAALAVAAGGISEAALAKSAEWLRRDRETIRRMNQRELARVRQRDAYYAERNRRVRAEQVAYARHRAAYQREMADYARQRRSYTVRLAAWRRDVADCRAGVRSACRR